METQTTTLTPDELHQLFEIGQAINAAQKEIQKLYALAIVYQGGLMFNEDNDIDYFSDVYDGIADILVESTVNIKSTLDSTRKDFSNLYSKKRNEVYCDE